MEDPSDDQPKIPVDEIAVLKRLATVINKSPKDATLEFVDVIVDIGEIMGNIRHEHEAASGTKKKQGKKRDRAEVDKSSAGTADEESDAEAEEDDEKEPSGLVAVIPDLHLPVRHL